MSNWTPRWAIISWLSRWKTDASLATRGAGIGSRDGSRDGQPRQVCAGSGAGAALHPQLGARPGDRRIAPVGALTPPKKIFPRSCGWVCLPLASNDRHLQGHAPAKRSAPAYTAPGVLWADHVPATEKGRCTRHRPFLGQCQTLHPVGLNAVVFVRLFLPVAVFAPGVVMLGRVFQLLFGQVGHIA